MFTILCSMAQSCQSHQWRESPTYELPCAKRRMRPWLKPNVSRKPNLTRYVDDMQAVYRRMVMCHMIADTTQELLRMAQLIGVARHWLQHGGTPREHFDICLSKRKLAVVERGHRNQSENTGEQNPRAGGADQGRQVMQKYGKHLRAIADFVYSFRVADNRDGTPNESEAGENSRFWLGIAAGQILDIHDNEKIIAVLDAIALAAQQAERKRCAKKCDARANRKREPNELSLHLTICRREARLLAAAIRKGDK